MTPQTAKQQIHDKGASVTACVLACLAASTPTKRCAVSCCDLACSASASQKHLDDKCDISSAKMDEAQMAENTAPTAQTSTDTVESGTSATDAIAATPNVPTVNKIQLRIKNVLLMACTSSLIATFLLYSIQIDAATAAAAASAAITAAMVLNVSSQLLIVYLHFLFLKYFR